MNQNVNKTQDLQSFSDTDLLLEMSWKDDPTSRYEVAFNIFYERYKVPVWSIVLQVCKNYTPHYGKHLPVAVLNNTFLAVFDNPLAKIGTFETLQNKQAIQKLIKLWIMELASNALRDLMVNGEEDYHRHHVLRIPFHLQSKSNQDDLSMVHEEEAPYDSDNISHAADMASDEKDDTDCDFANFDDDVDESLDALGDASDEQDEAEAEKNEFTEEQFKAAHNAFSMLNPRDRDIFQTLMEYEQKGCKTPRNVLENLRVRYQTTSDNLRAIKSRVLKQLRSNVMEKVKLQL